MKSIYKLIVLTFVALVVASCGADFEELNQNPNAPASVPPSLILRGVLSDLNQDPWSLGHRQNQFWCCNYNYYGTNEYWTNASYSFLTLKNVIKMEEEASKSGQAVNPYTALGKFMRAIFYYRMTMQVGDLPLTDALKGLENTTPSYNTQKEVFIQILEWLDESNTELKTLIAANDISLSGDIYYGNSLVKWRKAVNSFALRVLVQLSNQDSDSDLDVATRFDDIVSDPTNYPVFTSNDDNMNYVYNGAQQFYPTNPGNRGFDKGRYNMAQTYVKGLTDLNDPRVFVTCNPAMGLVNDGADPSAFSSYVGAPSGESLDDMTFKAGNGDYSFANQKRYYTSLAGPEPGVQLAYWEVCFNIAEGINRGWTTGNAATYYNAGITASMEFYGIENGAVLSITEPNNDTEIDTYTANVTNYLAQPSVTYAGNNATGLNQILTQKYLAFFQNSGMEAYYNYRRTGVPAFHAGPGTGNSGVIPRRWLYPSNETFYNLDNLTEAIQRQFGSNTDDVDDDLWVVNND